MNENKMSAGMKALLLVLFSMAAVALLCGLFTGLSVLPFGDDYNLPVNEQPQTHTGPPSTAPPTSVASKPGFTVNQDNVEVRTGPSPKYPVIGVVNRGQTFTPNGRTPAGDWLQFPWEGMDGWVNAPLLIVIGSGQLPVVRSIPPPPSGPDSPPPDSPSSGPDSPPPDSPPPDSPTPDSSPPDSPPPGS